MAALVLCICACTPPEPPPPPEAGTLDAAVLALRTGDAAALREHLGKGPGLAARANELAKSLDTEGWLIALGAVEREYDLPRAVNAMRAGDDAELAHALGFGQQALAQDILNGGSSIYSKRADARNFYETGAQPIALLDDIQPPGLPVGCQAIHVTLYGRLDGRELRVRYGLSRNGVTNLEADAELGRIAITVPASVRREPSAALALPRSGPCVGLDVSGLSDERWYGAQFILLTEDGAIQRLMMGEDNGWGLVEEVFTTREQRLEALRDRRLSVIGRKAGSIGHWPRGLADLNLQPRELVDPVPDAWAELQGDPARGFELAPTPGGEWVAASLHVTVRGRRAVDSEARLFWID